MKYIGINIGPVVKTLSLARRPRELWAASYLFSYLMKCIVGAARKHGSVIAPVMTDDEKSLKVGLYPDRLYMKPDNQDDASMAGDILEEAWLSFRDSVYTGVSQQEESDEPVDVRGNWLYKEYFNLMHTSCEADTEVDAVKKLNRQLDLLELCVMASNTDKKSDPQDQVMRLMQRTSNSSLFYIATGEKDFPVESLAEIAAARLNPKLDPDRSEADWAEFVRKAKDEDDKDNPYSVFKGDHKSYHRYFCVVQADGDNMGKTLTDLNLKDGSINKISSALLDFGKDAVSRIRDFGGMPVYAGGDDLLFLAPVAGKGGKHIFDLLDSLDSDSFGAVRRACAEALPSLNDEDMPSLSFGVSINFYKHPLYEALESARDLLFGVAKNVDGKRKKAIAWKLEKHSGESFEAGFSRKYESLDKAFRHVVDVTRNGQTVTQAIHKSRINWKLLTMCLKSGNQSRLDSFFKTVLEETSSDKKYFDAIKSLMTELFAVKAPNEDRQMMEYAENLYSMLRIAKFIKGEDLKDE